MQIPSFEMLSLLPDGDSFVAATAYRHRGKWKLRRTSFTLEQVSELAASQDIVVMVMRKGFGYAARLGRTYLKLDRKLVDKAGYCARRKG